jgi:Mn2+/Fe2+ NRAMP family transporter
MPGVRIRSARMVGPGWLIGTLRGGPGNGPTSIQVTVSKTLARIL